MRKLFLIPLMGLLLLVLTGCYNIDANLELGNDDTISGVVSMTVPKNTAPAQQKEIFKQIDALKEETIQVEKINTKELAGRKITLSKTPVALVFNSFSTIKLETNSDKDGHVLRGSFGEYSNLPILATAKTKKKKSVPIDVEPNWTISILFPHAITSATEGIEVVGSKATISNEFLKQGINFEIVTGAAEKETVVMGIDPEKYEPKAAPPAALPEIPEPRSPIPSAIFTVLLVGGLIAAVAGRFINFVPLMHKLNAGKENKPAKQKAKKPAKKRPAKAKKKK